MPQLSVASYNLYLGADLSLILGEQEPETLERNLAEVGRELGITRERARQIEREALGRLRETPRVATMAEFLDE